MNIIVKCMNRAALLLIILGFFVITDGLQGVEKKREIEIDNRYAMQYYGAIDEFLAPLKISVDRSAGSKSMSAQISQQLIGRPEKDFLATVSGYRISGTSKPFYVVESNDDRSEIKAMKIFTLGKDLMTITITVRYADGRISYASIFFEHDLTRE